MTMLDLSEELSETIGYDLGDESAVSVSTEIAFNAFLEMKICTTI
jgi:hypothetical protein